MSESKKVDPIVIRMAMEYAIKKARDEAPDFFDKFPPSVLPGGVEVTKTDWVGFVDESITEVTPTLKRNLEEFLGTDLPELEDDEELYNPSNPPKPKPDPDSDNDLDNGLYGHKHKIIVEWKNDWMTHRNENEAPGSGTKQRLFRFEGCGPDYGDSMVFEWDDGNILYVPNSKQRIMNPAPDKRKYQPGCGYGSVPDMEVYAPVGTNPHSVTMYYSKDNVTPSNPDDHNDGVSGDWKRMEWRGNPNDHSSRLWWTKIHGETPNWWRMWSLPDWMDKKPYTIDFRFSDGTTFMVPNSMKMAMLANGPKYHPAKSNDPNPDKRHPKISEKLGANATWMEYKIRK